MKFWVEADYPLCRWLRDPNADRTVERAVGLRAHSTEAGPFIPGKGPARGATRTLAWLVRDRATAKRMAANLRRLPGLRARIDVHEQAPPLPKAVMRKLRRGEVVVLPTAASRRASARLARGI